MVKLFITYFLSHLKKLDDISLNYFYLLKGAENMKPLIGITASFTSSEHQRVNNTYVKAVIRAGGIPVILPTGTEQDIERFVEKFDGFIFTGGGDVDPILFGEEPHIDLGDVEPERDAFELPFAQAILRSNKPLLGICRGMQVLNIALGGGVYQDLYAQQENATIQHSQKAATYHASHFVNFTKGSLMEEITGEETIRVNSFHHQAVSTVKSPLQVSGTANDGTIEAIESTTHSFVVGLQWHPEALIEKEDPPSLKLFDAFIKKSKESRE